MMIRNLTAGFLAILAATAAVAEPPREIVWDDLMPEGEAERMAQFADTQIIPLFGHGEGDDLGTPIPLLQKGTFNTVAELDGASIAIEGFVVPFDFRPGAGITEFLLVPFYGACIHVPPPPQNQMIYVTTDEPVEIASIWDPVRVEGVLSATTKLSDLGDAAYSMTLTRLEVSRR
jgi:hypothetical protein